MKSTLETINLVFPPKKKLTFLTSLIGRKHIFVASDWSIFSKGINNPEVSSSEWIKNDDYYAYMFL